MASNDDRRLRPICVFDSGLGGLTVVRELAGALPGEDIIYLGDTARVPYGIKSPETIRRFACEDAAFLLRFNPKMLVVACNTASAAAVDALVAMSPVPVIDMIRPGAAAACEAANGSLIGVIGTEATVRSKAYERAIEACRPGSQVCSVPCPLLVPIVEEGRDADDPIVTHVLCDYLRDMQRRRPGALILGCTHYPLLWDAIAKLMGPDVRLINSGLAAARQAQQMLDARGELNPRSSLGTLRCFTTDNPERFAVLGKRFGGRDLTSVAYVGTDELEGGPQ